MLMEIGVHLVLGPMVGVGPTVIQGSLLPLWSHEVKEASFMNCANHPYEETVKWKYIIVDIIMDKNHLN